MNREVVEEDRRRDKKKREKRKDVMVMGRKEKEKRREEKERSSPIPIITRVIRAYLHSSPHQIGYTGGKLRSLPYWSTPRHVESSVSFGEKQRKTEKTETIGINMRYIINEISYV